MISLLSGLEERAPWQSAGRPILLASGFDAHQGYERTIAAASKQKESRERIAALASALAEHAVAGEKLIQLIKVSEDERVSTQAWVRSLRANPGPLTEVFPGIADAAVMAAHVDKAPVSCGSDDVAAGSAAFFSAVRSHEERVEVPRSQLKPGNVASYERLIGIKRSLRQTHDSIWVPDQGKVICIAVDMPRGLPRSFAEPSLIFLQNRLRRRLGRPLVFYNLWNAVDGLYGQAGGTLVDYGFSVAGRSVNHHKARRNGGCLRKAVYDAAGAAAVGTDLQLFKIAMRWVIRLRDEIEAEPELLLPGTAMDLNRANAVLDYAILRDARTSTELKFVVDKLLRHAR